MIAFGSSITETEPYVSYAAPGIRFAAEPGSEVYPFAASGPITRSYNLLLDTAAARDDLEALVLVHSHVEITDPRFCTKIREVLSDPDVAVAGCAGATGVENIAWWEGAVRSAPIVHRYGEHGGGETQAVGWARPLPAPGAVDSIDGLLMVLSPWAVRNVRFDETMALGHGYDLDFCMKVRSEGRTVVIADLEVTYHRSLELVSDLELWVEAHMQTAEKWDGRMPGQDPGEEVDWERRARRAEAEREAARAVAHSNALRSDARVLALERRIEQMAQTTSWRVTEPLRWVNRLRTERRNGGDPGRS